MKKSTYLFAFALGASTITFAQNVGVNTDGSDPDANTILHIKNHFESSLDSTLLRIENEKATTGTGVQIENSGTASSKWDIIVPGSSTDLRIKGNGSDHVTIQNDGDVGISTTTPVSGLDVKTSMGYNINTFDASNPVPSPLNNSHNVILCNDGPYTVNLPAANTCEGRVYYIKNIDAEGDDITIDGNSTETIDGSETYLLDAYKYVVRIISDGTNWHVIEEFNPSGGSSVGSIASLDCESVTGLAWAVNVAVDEYISVPYTGDVAGSHSGDVANSTGVTGLTAELEGGTFSASSGNLLYRITGTPLATGTASFLLSIGGQSCVLTREVTCGGDVTFTYNGEEVTYGTLPGKTGGSPNGRCWLDRNLGASDQASSATDHNAYGDLFQWGRAADDRHQLINWISGTTSPYTDGAEQLNETTTTSSSPSPGHNDFIRGSYNWYTGSNPNDLWKEDGTGDNNPCPDGWRVPTRLEWLAENSAGNPNFPKYAHLKLPMAGNRRSGDGELRAVGTHGRYWSSTVSGANASLLLFDSSNAYMSNNGRAFGASVRCLKD